MSKAPDAQIVALVAKCISSYMGDLLFQQDEFGRFIGSPYDVFLRIDHLPVQPNAGETVTQYDQRLGKILDGLSSPTFVDGTFGSFRYHAQPFQFGPAELAGLKIFLRAANGATDTARPTARSTPATVPRATRRLAIPSKADRDQNYDLYLLVMAAHPGAPERSRHEAVTGSPQFADLGLWNVYLNPDMPKPQANIKSVICGANQDCSVDQGLGNTIARFKTPTLGIWP